MKDVLIGFILSFIIAIAAYWKKSLSFSGLMGAVVLGTSLYFFGGVYLCAIMISFFISSSLLTKVKEDSKKMLEDINEKGGRRDYIQVAANGSVGLLFAAIYFLTSNQIYLLAYGTAFAAANADTWASEIGVLSKSAPISILNFKKAENGVSGAVSLLGTVAAFLGSLFLAVVFCIGYIIRFGYNNNLIYLGIIITIAGFAGSIIDSIIGAALQAKYRCKICGKLTEKKYHHGQTAILVSGVSWINNDVVNLVSGVASSIIAIVTYILLQL